MIIKTREALCREISEIDKVLSEYKCLKYIQIMRLFPDKSGSIIKSIISRMINQKRIVYDDEHETLIYGGENKRGYDRGLIAAFWVLLDFIEKADYHLPSHYPVQIAFFMDDELYEIIYIERDRENMINYALSSQNPKQQANKIIVVSDENQIAKIKAEKIICFCIVGENGGIAYYDTE